MPGTPLRDALLLVPALLFAAGGALAQVPPPPNQPPPAQVVYSQARLDQLLAPIALYPDALLSQILMASTYPLEVVEAARWSRSHPGISGDEAVRAVEAEDWDPSVKSLVAFPDLVQRMDQNLEWTQALGDAFLAQEPQVMAQIQVLRSRALAAGQLAPNEHLRIADAGGVIEIEPVNPQVVYVPYYDPVVVYGAWRWPAYPPVFWAPWPGYVAAAPRGVHVTFFWGSGIRVAANFFFGAPDWHHRRVNVVDVHSFYYRPRVVLPQERAYLRTAPGPWRHDPWHRRGIDYRNAELQREYGSRHLDSGAQRTQWQQERQVERRQSSPVSPARQQQLQQQRQYERRQEREDQPSGARQMQQQRQQWQGPQGRAGDGRPLASMQRRDARSQSVNRPSAARQLQPHRPVRLAERSSDTRSPRGEQREAARSHRAPAHQRGDRGDRDHAPGASTRQ